MKCFWCNGEVIQVGAPQDNLCQCVNSECVAGGVNVTPDMLKQAHRQLDEATKCTVCSNEIGGICWECA